MVDLTNIWGKSATTKPVRKVGRRQFAGAQTGRLVSDWVTVPRPMDALIREGLQKLVARTREQSLNNDYVRRYIKLLRSNVVGPKGIVLQGRIVNERGEPDNRDNKALEEAWADWGTRGSCDVTGQMSWIDCENLFIETVAKDGEAMLALIPGWKHNRHSFAVQFIDTQSLDVNFNEKLRNGNVVRMGVETNNYLRPVAYWLRVNPTDAYDYLANGVRYRRIDASRVIHRYMLESAWQTRGFPWLAASLMKLNMLDGYTEAELVAARVGSAKMGFFETQGDAMYEGDDVDSDGNIVMDADPGTFATLPQGVKLAEWSPDHPSTAFDSFIKTNLRGLAAGMGVSYFSLANDLEGVNNNSARVGLLEDREMWKQLQRWQIESLCQPVFNAWLPQSLLAGGITNPNGTPVPARRLDKFSRVSWQPKRWQWVDPKKEMDSYREGLALKILSPQQVIQDMGTDPDQVLEDWEVWNQKLEAKNLGMLFDGGKQIAPEPGDQNEND